MVRLKVKPRYIKSNGARLLKFFTAAYLIFVSSAAFAEGDKCRDLIFAPARVKVSDPAKIEAVSDLAIKKTTRLDEVGEKLRRLILESGEIDTTKLRSEFKHYIEASKTDLMIEKLRREFPPQYDLSGKLISGLTSRDNIVKVKATKLESAIGEQKFGLIQARGLKSALLMPEVYSQHKQQVRESLTEIFGAADADRILVETQKLHEKAIAETGTKGRHTYTDTASTSKFVYKSNLTREAILESAKEFGVKLNDNEILAFTHLKYDKLTETSKSYLVEKVVSLGIKKEKAEKFVADLADRSTDEGVIRFRKYRVGPENFDFAGIPSPSSSTKNTNTKIRDAEFANGVTWLEFKMKNSGGEATRQTVVNKPRLPMRDEKMSMLKDRSLFVSEVEFEKTKAIIKAEVKETVALLAKQGVKEAVWNEKEADAALEFIRKLHLQGHSLEPVGRTVYMRDSYNLNLVDSSGKSQNIQITRDRHVWELNRENGQLLQALPWIERTRGWQFQYNAVTGWYEHKNSSGVVEHSFHPRFPEIVYEVNNGTRREIQAKLDPVEVVELKVPVKLIRLSKEDVEELPQLQSVVDLRKQMIAETEDLNARRKELGLAEFAIDKGKRATSRSDVAGGITLLVNPKYENQNVRSWDLVAKEFKLHPETGYWINLSEGADLIYHPGEGVMKLNGTDRITTSPVYFKEAL